MYAQLKNDQIYIKNKQNVVWLLMVWLTEDFSKVPIYWDFYTQPSLKFPENGSKQEKVSSGSW